MQMGRWVVMFLAGVFHKDGEKWTVTGKLWDKPEDTTSSLAFISFFTSPVLIALFDVPSEDSDTYLLDSGKPPRIYR